ncbi:hypothetical protein Ahy_B09g094924 isoform B [Arachis hypogaea]|uniref:Aminotransferase-like plant mobile domain-containing protein n=1 Tax=Arachis hypogaea TaxID=3818 RepID=A0A444XCS5_ARAHY|nr:hypothetical protein Ahy_B09g094924 isoform B [Arachis hypogaea]
MQQLPSGPAFDLGRDETKNVQLLQNVVCDWAGKGTKLRNVPRCLLHADRSRDTKPCDTQESVERYVRAHIFCVLGTVVFPDKSATSLNSKFLPLFRDFNRISAYS